MSFIKTMLFFDGVYDGRFLIKKTPSLMDLGSSGLVDIHLTNFQVGELGPYAFSGCSSFVDSNHYFSDLEVYPLGVFRNCSSLTGVTFNGTIEIGRNAFIGCSNLGRPDGEQTVIILSPAIERIGIETFVYVSPLTAIVLNRTKEEMEELTADENAPWYNWDKNFFGIKQYLFSA